MSLIPGYSFTAISRTRAGPIVKALHDRSAFTIALQGSPCNMLSYRHAFHAGNHADVLKHLVLTATLSHATQKAAPLFYLDTHAGAGLYSLDSEQAQKSGEATAGILSLDFQSLLLQLPAAGRQLLAGYQELVQPCLLRRQYPGSPLLAKQLLRRHDHLHLFELHASDFPALQKNMANDMRIRCEQRDGFANSLALLPPVQNRAVVLIDPSYELKDDYRLAAEHARRLCQRMPSAQILLWYPVVRRGEVGRMIEQLTRKDIRDLWQIEMGVRPDDDKYGMTASGMLVINPPWTLAALMRECLPVLQSQLAPRYGHWQVKNLAPE